MNNITAPLWRIEDAEDIKYRGVPNYFINSVKPLPLANPYKYVFLVLKGGNSRFSQGGCEEISKKQTMRYFIFHSIWHTLLHTQTFSTDQT